VLAGPLDPLSQRLRSNVLSVENEAVPSRNYTTLQAWLCREVSSVSFWTVPFATDAMRTAFDNHDGHRDGQEAREAGKYVVWLARLVHYIGSQHLCMGFRGLIAPWTSVHRVIRKPSAAPSQQWVVLCREHTVPSSFESQLTSSLYEVLRTAIDQIPDLILRLVTPVRIGLGWTPIQFA